MPVIVGMKGENYGQECCELSSTLLTSNHNWIVMGDFNEVKSPEDRISKGDTIMVARLNLPKLQMMLFSMGGSLCGHTNRLAIHLYKID